VSALEGGINLEFATPVTFLVAENGSGKPTLLEVIVACDGFKPEGGSHDQQPDTQAEGSLLARSLRLAWLPKVYDSFFMRAECFFNSATYLDGLSSLESHGALFLPQ
jgi:predicted ATPase